MNEEHTMNKLNICMCCNRAYLHHVVEVAWSISQNDKSPATIHVFIDEHNDVDDIQRACNSMRMPNIQFKLYNIGCALQRFTDCINPSRSSYSTSAYARLLMFDILSDFDRVIYLDCDVRVLKPCLNDLMDLDMGNCMIAASIDYGIYLFNDANELETTKTHRYFNTGVCVFDIQKCIQNGIKEQIDRIVADQSVKLKYADQTILNIIFNDGQNVKFIDATYNTLMTMLGFNSYSSMMMNQHKSYTNYLNAVKIAHFCGGLLPYDIKSLSVLPQHIGSRHMFNVQYINNLTTFNEFLIGKTYENSTCMHSKE